MTTELTPEKLDALVIKLNDIQARLDLLVNVKPGICGKKLHDLSILGARTKSGKCRVCWNAYRREYNAAKRRHPSRAAKG